MKSVKRRSETTILPPAPVGGSVAACPPKLEERRRKQRGGQVVASRAKRDPLATRRALTGAAAAIFKREGYFATDSNAIARRAGYAPGSFYNHFADKTAILLAVYENYVDLEWRGVRRAAAAPPPKRIPAILDVIETLHGEWARFRTDLRAVSRLEPKVAAALAASRAKQMDMLSELTGLSRAKHGPRLLIALALVERYAELLADAKTLDLPAAAVKRQLAAALQDALADA